jgi:hypothetical protein
VHCLLETDSYEKVGPVIQKRLREIAEAGAGPQAPTPEDVEVQALAVHFQARRGDIRQAEKEMQVLASPPPSELCTFS